MTDARTLSGIGDTVDSAVEWIHSHYTEFMRLDAKIRSLAARAARVAIDAEDAGEVERKESAEHALRQLSSIQDLWAWTSKQMAWVASKIPGVGMGAWIVPVIVGGVALAVAGAAATVLYRLSQQERLIDLLEEGSITVDEARALGVDVGGGLVEITPGLGVLLLAAGAGFLWHRSRSRRA